MVSIGFIYALAAAVTLSGYALLARRILTSTPSPLVFSVVYNVWGVVCTLPLFFLEPWQFSTITAGVLGITFLATLSFAIMMAGEFMARKYVEVSRLTVFFQLVPLVAVIGGVAFFSDSITGLKALGILLILVGNTVAIYRAAGKIDTRGLLFGLVSVIAAGLGLVADKAVFSHYPLGLYVLITYFFPGLYLYLALTVRGTRHGAYLDEIKRLSWRLPVLALLNMFGYYFILKAFSHAELSLVLPVVYSSSILTVLGGILLLKENKNIPQKLIGVLLVFCGVLILKF